MVIRGDDGALYWQDLTTGALEPYTGQDLADTGTGAATGAFPGPGGASLGDAPGSDYGGNAGPAPAEPFDPNKHPITKITKLPGGTQYQYTDSNGANQVTFVPDTTGGAGGGISATSKAQLDAQQAALAQNQSQFQSNQDMERAKFNEQYALDQGKTLLGLGSRPDTLIKYLYALRGQQTPQAIAGTTTNLPGFQNVVGQPNPQNVAGAAAPVAAPAPTAAPAPAVASPANFGNNAPAGTAVIPGTPYVGAPGAGLPTPSLSTGGMSIPGTAMTQGRSSALDNASQVQQALAPGISIGMANGTGPNATPPLHVGGNTAVPAGVVEDPSFQPFRQSVADNIVKGQVSAAQQAAGPKAIGPGGIAIYKHGGLIPEPVMGIGLHSGQKYLFGEAGPEHVEPGKGRKPAPPINGQHAYADGGTIGYDPTVGPMPGEQASGPIMGGGTFSDPTISPMPGERPTGPVLGGGTITNPAVGVFPGEHSTGAMLGGGTFANPTIGPMPGERPTGSIIGGGNYGDPTVGPMPGERPQSGGINTPFGSASTGLTGGAGGWASMPIPPISPNVFNNPNLQSVVQRGYNSDPNTPLFPQIGIATNGGQSLIPSAQRYNALTPTEQSLYAGALQDEFGVMPDDVFSLSRQLAPHISGLHTPRFAN